MSEIIANMTKITLLQQQTAFMMTMQICKAYQEFFSYNLPYMPTICNVSKKK